MTKTLLKGLLAIIVSGTLLTSCKKEKEDILPSAKDNLVGKWEFAYIAYDENGNKVLDEKEKDTDVDGTLFYFYPDGTGYVTYDYTYYPGGYDDKEYFTWSFANNDKELVMVINADDYIETMNAKLITLNGNDMVLEINENYGSWQELQWIGMTKQPL